MLKVFVVRSWLVVVLAALAGGAAWWVVRDDAKIYEHSVAFVLLPSAELADEQVPDAVRGLSQQDAQLVNTIAGTLGNDRFLREAANLGSGEEIPAGYDLDATVRPGSDIVDATISGPDPAVLESLVAAYAQEAARWVDSTYRAYGLEVLADEPSAGPVAPQVRQTVTLAALLGGLLALGAIFAETKARGAASERATRRRPPPSTDEAVLVSVEDIAGRTDRIEALLRSHLEDGESVVRVGARRLGIVRSPETRRPQQM